MKSIEELIIACRKYDRSSQNELFHRFADQVMSIAKRYVVDDYKAKDVFLKSFEKALNNISKFDEKKGSFKNWLSRITVNEAINQLKYDKRNAFVEIDSACILSHKVELIEKIDYNLIIDLIQNLKAPYGLIFNMVQDGYKHKEIAAFLNITEATSRSYYKRSRLMIQNKLSKKFSNYDGK